MPEAHTVENPQLDYYMSAQQRRLWSSGRPQEFVSQCALRILGAVDRQRWRRAVDQVVGRFEILRTRFAPRPGLRLPVQAVDPRSLADWAEVPAGLDRRAPAHQQAAELLRSQRQRPYDLAADAPLRVALVELEGGDHLLAITLPALVADRRSLAVLVGELLTAYVAAGESADDELVQYGEFAAWQEQLAEEDEEDDDESRLGRQHWQQMADLEPARLSLPGQRQGGGEADGSEAEGSEAEGSEARGSSPSLAWRWQPPAATVADLTALASGHRADWPTVVLAAWQLLLSRLAGAPVMVGRLVDGCMYDDLAEVLGPLGRCLPLAPPAADLELSFDDYLAQIADADRRLVERQEFAVVDRLPRCAALFEVAPQMAELVAEGVALNWLEQSSSSEPCTLQLVARLGGARDAPAPELVLAYDSERMDEAAAQRLGQRLQTLLEAALANPTTTLGDLPLMGATERAGLLAAGRGEQHQWPPPSTLHRWFESRVAKTAQQPALADDSGRCFTYAELEAASNRLARHLRDRGVGREQPVGLLLERSAELVMAMLAILKAGAAYLPLEPALPPARRRQLIVEAGAKWVVSRADLATAEGPEIDGVKQVWLDTEAAAIDRLDDSVLGQADLDGVVQPENLSYVLFTSGSTGRPKGVAVEHRQLVDYVHGVGQRLGFEIGWSFATLSTFAADLGLTTVFPALLSGGCLHVLSAEAAADPQAVASYFSAHPIDCLKIVPSHLNALMAGERPAAVLPRRLLVLGGEAPPPPLLQRLGQLAADCRIANHYGPTETTVGVVAKLLDDIQESPPVALGRPLANAAAWVLDRGLRPLPSLVDGELCLAGAGLARGYLGRPAATAERFLPNPFGELGGERLYRSGDRARVGGRGELEFRGRTDHQVKVRGFRVELGEIDSRLVAHPEVAEALSMLREDRPGEHRLVAYWTAARGAGPTVDQLRGHLAEALPDYMVPAVLVRLPSLPLTANGKVDRLALPVPEQRREVDYVAPRGLVEEQLAGIWSEVLGVEQIGVHDNFFALGGDSILTIQVVAKANRVGLALRPRQLFEQQTIAALAEVAEPSTRRAEQGLVVGEAPLTPIQQWFFDHDFERPHHWNQSLSFVLMAPLEIAVLAAAMERLLAHHDALRLRFQRQGDGWLQVHQPPQDAPPPVHRIDLSGLPQDSLGRALGRVLDLAQGSLDLGRGPLLRAVVVETPGEIGRRLLLVAHHLVMDAVSWRVLLEDLQSLCVGLARGEEVELPAKSSSFQDWAARLADHADSALLRDELPYWQELEAADGLLPRDFADGRNTLASADSVEVELDSGLTEGLLRQVPEAYRTQINDALLAGLMPPLLRWTGRAALQIDLEGHGREDLFDELDVSRTVGWFTSHYPLRLSVGLEDDPGSRIVTIKEQLRRLPANGIGYGLLRYMATPDAQLAALRSAPEPELSFNYLGQLDQVLTGESALQAAPEGAGPARWLAGERTHVLQIVGRVVGGRLALRFTFSPQLHRRQRIEALAGEVLDELAALVEHCRVSEAGATPSDFPLADLQQTELEQLSGLLTELDEEEQP